MFYRPYDTALLRGCGRATGSDEGLCEATNLLRSFRRRFCFAGNPAAVPAFGKQLPVQTAYCRRYRHPLQSRQNSRRLRFWCGCTFPALCAEQARKMFFGRAGSFSFDPVWIDKAFQNLVPIAKPAFSVLRIRGMSAAAFRFQTVHRCLRRR